MILDELEGNGRTKNDIANMWLNHLTTFRVRDIQILGKLYGDEVEIVNNLKCDSELEMLASKGVLKQSTCQEIRELDIPRWYDNLSKLMVSNKIKCLTPADEMYPDRLRTIDHRPLALYYRGKEELFFTEHSIAIIGSRRPTHYGLTQAEHFSAELAKRGITIISGMAYGIDSRAHDTAIKNGGGTIAVLGGGVDICYPRTNMSIYQEMCDEQLVISEYEPGTAHISQHFPLRNRIISGLSDGVLLVEAALRSGTLITADYALEQGKSIYGIPGRPTDVMSRGVNSIIKQGAMLVDSPTDIILDMFKSDLEVERPKRKRRKKETEEDTKLSATEKQIIGILGYEPLFIDDIIRHNEMHVAETLQTLNELVSKGKIKCVEKGYYILS